MNKYLSVGLRTPRERARLQGGRVQARGLRLRGRAHLPALPGLLPRQERLRLALLHHAGAQDKAGEKEERKMFA